MGYICLSTLVSSGYMPRSGIARSYGCFIPSVLRNCLFIVAVSIYIPTNSARAFPFLHTLSSIYCCRLFDDGCSDWFEDISHCSFDLQFSNNKRCWASFHVFVSHLYVFFEEMSVLVSPPLFDWVVCCLCCWVIKGVCIFWRLSPYGSHHLQIFSLIP